MALKENYKDDILDTSQNVKRKYQMENNGDGTVSFTDVTEYTQQGDSFGSSDLNAMAHAINNISSDAEHTSYDNTESGLISDNVQGAIDEINDNLSGFKFYPTGTQIVGLISDDSAYTDADGNYVIWGTATANQLVADNPNTYKSVPSTEDTRGKEGADTAIPFKGGVKPTLNILSMAKLDHSGSAKYTLINSLDADFTKIVMIVSNYSTYGNIYKNNVLFTDFEKVFEPTSPDYSQDSLIKFNANKGDKIEVTRPQYSQYNCFVLASNTDVELVEKSEITSAGSYTFTASKDYEVLYAFVNRGGYYVLSSYSSRLTAHPTIYPDANGGSRIYTFYDVKQGDTITFTAQYNSTSSCCVFAPK